MRWPSTERAGACTGAEQTRDSPADDVQRRSLEFVRPVGSSILVLFPCPLCISRTHNHHREHHREPSRRVDREHHRESPQRVRAPPGASARSGCEHPPVRAPAGQSRGGHLDAPRAPL